MFRQLPIRIARARRSRRPHLESLEPRKLLSTVPSGPPRHAVPAHVAKIQPASPAAPDDRTSQPSTITVPLTVVQLDGKERLGVKLSVAGSEMRTYLLDTGSTGLYAAKYKLHKADYTLLSQKFRQKYSSSIEYRGLVANASVAFEAGPVAKGVYLGIIKKVKGIPDWKSLLKKGKAPYDGAFYGTLGMSLVPGDKKHQGNLYSIIAQLPGNLNSGFIIHTGGMDGKSPTLTIGLDAENTRGFTTVQMPAANGKANAAAYQYGNGRKNHVLAWNDKGVSVNYAITGMPGFSAPTVFDTGEASTTLYTNNVPGDLLNGRDLVGNLLFQAGITPGVNWSFTTGTTGNVNRVHVTPKPRSTVNTGIGLFFQYDVMVDIKDGTIGFRPVKASS